MAASAEKSLIVHDGNLNEVTYDIDGNAVKLRYNNILDLTFLFSLHDDKLVVKERVGGSECVLERLDNNNRTRILRDEELLVDSMSEPLCNAIDAIEFGFGISDFARQVEKDEKERPGLKMSFLYTMMRMIRPDGDVQ